MKARDNEILLIYNSEKQEDRKTKGYADTLKEHRLNERDIQRDSLTETQLAEVANDMNIPLIDLVDKNSEFYMNQLKDRSFSDEELTKLMVKNPDLIKTPIAYVGSRVFFVGSAYQFVKEDFEIKGVKSPKANKFEK